MNTACIETALAAYLQEDNRQYKERVYEAMEYSLLAGGKRIRPQLTLLFSLLCGGSESLAMPFACALEMIHTYSLIHDDLPCMDNDALRRGRPTNHIVFGEDIALLAGDGLLTKAFEVALRPGALSPEKVLRAAGILARFAGANGMIGGQCIDLMAEGKQLTLPELAQMDLGKTVALIEAGCRIGVVVGGGDSFCEEAAAQYAQGLGMAFQIRDDILDVIGDTAVLGKEIGADALNEKCNYVTLLGVEKATALVAEYTEKALVALTHFPGDTTTLREFALSMERRQV